MSLSKRPLYFFSGVFLIIVMVNDVIKSEEELKSKIYTIRGVQVMMDKDLAEIYGYSTKDFNRQVRNNIERFDEDFMFQLTNQEVQELSRCKFFTLKTGRGPL